MLRIADGRPRFAARDPLPARSSIRRTGTSPVCAPQFLSYFNINAGELGLEELGIEELRTTLWKVIEHRYTDRESRHEPEVIRGFERAIMLHGVDVAWKDHLLALDHLKEGIGLRGYGQRDPLNEYKRESFELFESMKERIEDDILQKLFRYEPMSEEQVLRAAPPPGARRRVPGSSSRRRPRSKARQRPQPSVSKEAKVGRNDPCPCGSGKKYKKCHGAAVTVG